MRKFTQRALVTFGLILLGGCASTEDYTVATQHYRTSERFDHVAIDVRASDELAMRPDYRNLHNDVEADLKYYLDHLGVEISTPDELSEKSGRVRLELTLNEPHMRLQDRDTDYRIAAKLTGQDGRVIKETTLYLNAGASSPRAKSQQMAEIIADHMLLMWYPAMDVFGEEQRADALLPSGNSVDASKHQSRFWWEFFPSERIMQGADFDVSDISDVSYELRLKPYNDFEFYSLRNEFQQRTRPEYRVSGLTLPEHTLPFSLPTCEHARWSVRAHFKLRGSPRVTQWSNTQSARGSRYGSVLTHNDVSGQFKCNSSDQRPRNRQLHLELDELQVGQSIAAVALVSDFCDEDGCEARMTTQEASENMADCLSDELRKRGMGMPVHDMAELLAELPTRPELGDEPTDIEGMFAYFRRPENSEYLNARGIRYVVTAGLSMKTTGSKKNLVSGEAIGLVVATSETHYESTIDSSVFDIEKGEVVATLASYAEGVTGVAVPTILFIPFAVIPHGSKNRIENRACDAMAKRLAFALKGGVAGWPKGFFKDTIWPQWEYDEKM